MMRLRPIFLALILSAAAGAAAYPVFADDAHDEARTLLQRGEIRPLSEILAKVQKEIPCEIVEVEFERDDDMWVYEIKAIDTSGRFMKIHVDATNAAIIRVKKKHAYPAR